MQILTKSGNVVQPVAEIVQLLQQASTQFGSAGATLAALQAFAADPAQNGPIGAVADALHVDRNSVAKFINDNSDALTLLLGNIGQLGDKSVSWPISGSTAANAGVVSIELKGDAFATVAVDDDGDLFGDGKVSFDKTKVVFTKVEVGGTISANAGVTLPVHTATTKVAFGASA